MKMFQINRLILKSIQNYFKNARKNVFTGSALLQLVIIALYVDGPSVCNFLCVS